jgi:tRNA pseudouridine38-40 synthase
VHALGQVASFEAEAELDPPRLLRGCNGLLPPDARVWAAGRATAGFSARATATWRRYAFRMARRPTAVGRRTHHVLRWGVDAAAMHAAAQALLGTHDFSAFAPPDPGAGGRECTVLEARVRDAGPVVVFEIRANRFVHNMVRRLTGALVEVGRGRLDAGHLAALLASRDPSRGGPCLGPEGLFLVEVGYPPDPEFDATARVDGLRWSP